MKTKPPKKGSSRYSRRLAADLPLRRHDVVHTARDPHQHVNQRAEVVEDQGAIELHGPIACETTVLYRILARIDGSPWSWQLAAQDEEAATFTGKAKLEGHLKWLRAQADKHPSPKLEYCAIPIFVASRNL